MASQLLSTPLALRPHSTTPRSDRLARFGCSPGSGSLKTGGFSSRLAVAELDYQSPRPYSPKLPNPAYTPPEGIPASDVPSQAPTPSGNESAKKFWTYVFQPSVSPARYNSPVAYRAPAPYGPEEPITVRSVDIASIDVGSDGGNDGGNDGNDGNNGKGGGGSGGDGGSKGENNEEESYESKRSRLTQSQKITLAYALLISFGGLVGFLTSGSVKSLAAGFGSALVLIFVFAILPSKPVLASCVGFAVSASLFDKMSSRYWKTNKFFPAGFIAVLSFIMSGGYVHGVIRGLKV